MIMGYLIFSFICESLSFFHQFLTALSVKIFHLLGSIYSYICYCIVAIIYGFLNLYFIIIYYCIEMQLMFVHWFCILQVYWICVFVLKSFGGVFRVFFRYDHIICKWHDFTSFPVWMPFISILCLIALVRTPTIY